MDNEQKVKSEFWQKLASNLAHVPFAEDAIAARSEERRVGKECA